MNLLFCLAFCCLLLNCLFSLLSLDILHYFLIIHRLKQLENDIEKSVSPSQCFFIRLDGCTFSTFLKGVRKPFDSRITDAMVKTTADLVFKFQPTLGYTSSDEITLAFPAAIEQIFEDGSSSLSKDSASSSRKAEKKKRLEKSHAYNGRIQKLASVASGYARYILFIVGLF